MNVCNYHRVAERGCKLCEIGEILPERKIKFKPKKPKKPRKPRRPPKPREPVEYKRWTVRLRLRQACLEGVGKVTLSLDGLRDSFGKLLSGKIKSMIQDENSVPVFSRLNSDSFYYIRNQLDEYSYENINILSTTITLTENHSNACATVETLIPYRNINYDTEYSKFLKNKKRYDKKMVVYNEKMIPYKEEMLVYQKKLDEYHDELKIWEAQKLRKQLLEL